jgi:hypothetical protein
MMVNVCKTKVTIFNAYKNCHIRLSFLFQREQDGDHLGLNLLGVQFNGPGFSFRLAAKPWLIEWYGSFSILEHQCIHTHFQDILGKMHPFKTILQVDCSLWGQDLGFYLPADWACIQRVQPLML